MPIHSHYDVLQLDSHSASPDEIKRAFRRLSMEHHPDKNGNSEESKCAFQKINEAYNVLSDPVKRNNYDFEMQMGIGGTTAHGIRMGPMGHMGHMGSINPLDMLFAAMHQQAQHHQAQHQQAQHHQAQHQQAANMFESIFGGGMGMGMGMGPGIGPKIIIHNFTNTQATASRSQPHPHDDVSRDDNTNLDDSSACDVEMITISLPEAYTGCKQRPVTISYHDENLNKQKETVFIDIMPGVANGHMFRIAGSDSRRGAITIQINIADHPVFCREGEADLVVEHRVSLKDALCGFTFELVHLNGRSYKFNCKPCSITGSMNETKVMPGLGYTDGGALKIRFYIDLPTSLTEEQITTLSSIL
jgi:DnaJ-class molecular chaperone